MKFVTAAPVKQQFSGRRGARCAYAVGGHINTV